MSSVSRYAFIHAKMHGLMAKTWSSERLRFLVKISSLLELSKTLFPGEASSSGEADIVADVQRKFEQSVIKTLIGLAALFPSPPELLVHVLREYEYRNLLTLLREKFSGLTDIQLWDIGKFSVFKKEGFPQSLRGTFFEKYIALMENSSLPDIEQQAARQYYAGLIDCVKALPAGERALLLPLAETEIILQNLLWALRLRFYFSKNFDDAEALLFPLGSAGLMRKARLIFELPLDDPKQWEALGYAGIFTAQRDGVIDPETIEDNANRYICKSFRKCFYAHSFTLASIYAFFRIKKYEARLVTSVSEGIRMGISSREIAEAVSL